MVDRPGLVVRVERAAEWKVTGPMAARAEAYAQRFVETLPPSEHRSYCITVEHAAAEHTGLGVGTQLAMAIAKAIAIESDHSDWPAAELAKRVGRGERSAIGIHGFDHGGLVVEGGKLPGEVVSPLVARFDFPPEWSVLLFTPPMETPWHGGAEKDAFLRLVHLPDVTDRLCRIALMGLLPAFVEQGSGDLWRGALRV